MKFTKVSSGNYKFEGIDSWTNKIMKGNIIYQPYDVKLSQAWQVVFGLDTDNQCTEFFGKSLKECKDWLTF